MSVSHALINLIFIRRLIPCAKIVSTGKDWVQKEFSNLTQSYNNCITPRFELRVLIFQYLEYY